MHFWQPHHFLIAHPVTKELQNPEVEIIRKERRKFADWKRAVDYTDYSLKSAQFHPVDLVGDRVQ